MFTSGANYSKLKTNLRLSINRLKLLEKKKTELAQKARKEIADYISAGKVERAKIRVEHIIREDYLVEAMEVTEMYCDLVLARFGLIQQMKDLDSGLAEPISSLIWVGPRLMSDVPELKVVGDQFALKYGKPYAQACREQSVSTISEKLIHKMSVQAPPKVLVEKYLQEIASNYNLEYTPDPQVMKEAEWASDPLISLEGMDSNNLNNEGGGGSSSGGASGGGGGGGGGASGGGGGGMNIPLSQHPFSYASKAAEAAAGDLNLPNVPGQPSYPPPQNFQYPPPSGGTPFSYPGAVGLPPTPAVEPTDDTTKVTNIGYPQYPGPPAPENWDEMLGLDNSPPPPYASLDDNNAVRRGGINAPPSAPPPSLPSLSPQKHTNFPPDVNTSGGSIPKPAPRSKFDDSEEGVVGGGLPGFNLPDLPNVPSTASSNKDTTSPDDIDFDDLNKRFLQLKKK